MKNALWTVLIILCWFSSAEARIVDRVYAQVNEDIITISDVDRKLDTIRRELERELDGDELEEAVLESKDNVLNELIEEKLLVQKAIELGIDAEVEPKVSSQLQEIMKQNNIETMDVFEETLEKQGTNLRDFRDLVRNQIMADEIIYAFVRSRITLLKSEVEKFYKDHAQEYAPPEEVSLSEIIVTVESEGNEESAERKVLELYVQLKNGDSFTSLAKQFSQGATADTGGDIGDNLLEKWHPDIIEAIAGLEVGDVTEPQKIQGGYVIYRVDSRKPSIAPPFEEIENRIKDRIYTGKYTSEYGRFIERLKEDAYIQIYPDPE